MLTERHAREYLRKKSVWLVCRIPHQAGGILRGHERLCDCFHGFLAALLVLFVSAIWVLPAAAAPTPVTTAKQVHDMPPDEAERGLPVHLVATVTYYEPGYNLLFVSDMSGSVFVWVTHPYPLHVGDLIDIKGITERSLRTRVAGDADIHVLAGHRSIAVKPSSYNELMTGERDCQYVSIRGIVRSASLEVHNNYTVAQLQVLVPGGIVQVYMQDPRGLNLNGLIDADIEIAGAAAAEFNARYQTMRPKLFVSSAANLKILRQPTVNPLELPTTEIENVMASHMVVNQSKRVHLQGAVTAFDPGYSLVIQHEGHGLLVLTRQMDELPLGTVVDVIGFADDHAYSAVLEDAQFYPIGHMESVVPQKASYSEALSGMYSDTLIQMSGHVLSKLQGESSDTLVIMVEQHPVSLVLRHSKNRASLPDLAPGAQVRVNGVCRVTPGITWRKPLLFRMDLRSSSDVEVLSLPSWWNFRHLLIVGSGLLASWLLIMLWVLVLRRRVALQTRRIERSIQVERERSRLLEQINSENPLNEVLRDICGSITLLVSEVCCYYVLLESETGTTQAALSERSGSSEFLYKASLSDARGKQVGMFRVESLKQRVLSPEEKDVLTMGASLANLAVNQRRMYDELNYHSSHDQLTALPNRRLADMRLEEVIEQAERTGTCIGVAYIDVDQFKQVNDRHGHKVGDLYLQQIASRLGAKVRATDLLARVGGDEFLLIATALQNLEDVQTYKDRLCGCFKDPFSLDGVLVHGSASIGIAVYPDHGTTSEALKKYADTEMYSVKHRAGISEERGRGTGRSTEIFSPADLRAALDASQFKLFYQPQFSSTGQLCGLEALLRLHDPILGIVSPDAFISIAEQSDFILPLGAWVLRQALEDARQWQLGVRDKARIVVNVSARQIEQPQFAEEVAMALAQSGVPANTLELEITERTIITNCGNAVKQLSTLRALGVHISINDFGTGHSSLSMLHKLPVDTLKINRSFISLIESEPAVLQVIETVVCLARSLGKRIVAEGVESERDFQTMLEMDEMDFQGYLFSRPLAADAIQSNLTSWRMGLPLQNSENSLVLTNLPLPAATLQAAAIHSTAWQNQTMSH